MQLFGAIGLARLGTIATDRTKALSARGDSLASALTGGYHLAYLVGAVAVAIGVFAALLILRPPVQEAPQALESESEMIGVREPSAQAA